MFAAILKQKVLETLRGTAMTRHAEMAIENYGLQGLITLSCLETDTTNHRHIPRKVITYEMTSHASIDFWSKGNLFPDSEVPSQNQLQLKQNIPQHKNVMEFMREKPDVVSELLSLLH
jgi:hypothetical protein